MIRLVIFDCDGVLVDSEPASRAAIAAEAEALGCTITPAESHGFTGLRWSDLKPVFEARAGRALPADWPDRMQARLIAVLDGHLRPVPGAREAILDVRRAGLPYRVASNSSHEEMAVKFALAGLAYLVSGLACSARDVGVGKPAPDLFLHAAALAGVAPRDCLVIEDSRPGAVAARAAGMRCLGYAPDGDVFGLADQGAVIIRSLAELSPHLTRQGLAA